MEIYGLKISSTSFSCLATDHRSEVRVLPADVDDHDPGCSRRPGPTLRRRLVRQEREEVPHAHVHDGVGCTYSKNALYTNKYGRAI